jgi:hypothetical protein
MLFQFDGQEFVNNFSTRYAKLSNHVKTMVLPDGRMAQIQIVITTNENEFCVQQDTMNAIINKTSEYDAQ